MHLQHFELVKLSFRNSTTPPHLPKQQFLDISFWSTRVLQLQLQSIRHYTLMIEVKSGVITQKTFDVSRQRRNLLLLDRDGTLNYDKGHTYKVEDLSVIDNNVKQLANLTDQETAIYCITNQSGIDRCFYTYEQAMFFNSALANQLPLFDIHVEKFIMCPHTMEAQCLCRKPKTL